MAITWTIFVLGALLHDMQCNSMESTTPASTESTSPNSTDSTKSVTEVSTSTTLQTPISSPSSNPIIPSTISNISTTLMPNTPNTNTNPNPSTTTESILSIEQINITPTKLISSSVTPLKSTTNSLKDSTLSLTTLTILTTKEQTEQPGTSDSPQVTTQITTLQPTIPNTNTSPTASNLHTPPFSQETTSSNTPAVTTYEESGTSPDKQTSAVTTNPAPKPTLTVSQSTQKQETQTTSAPITSTTLPATSRPDYLTTSTSTPGNLTYPVFDLSRSSEGNVVLEACKMLGQKMKGNCSATLDIQGNKLIATITINADQIIKTENYKPQEQKDDVVSKKEPIPDTLIAILASSGALVLILCCFAAYCTYHRRSYRKNQQHLTEELQTVENGYHDNPTLEVMEVQPEMQEKKLTLNGEFNDSWIVPIDNLLKEDLPDEEDTHL